MSSKAVHYDFETEGKIVSYDPQRHCGIIKSPMGDICYYDKTAEKSGLNRRQLTPGTEVMCKVARREKGLPKAKEITLLS